MIKTIAIKPVNPLGMSIIWDIGRRCNYDCTYCEATRHNNFSEHKRFDQLKSTLEFIKEYCKLYGYDTFGIGFTGGEPTNNPIFFEFAEYCKSQNVKLGLTTNGAFGKKYIRNIVKNFDWITISYHAEADPKLKKKIIENIKALNSQIRLSVNVMMHKDYWDECVSVCDILKEHNIKFNPRPIGDGNITRKGWFLDTDGTLRRTSHDYTPEQQQWYFDYMQIPAKASEAKEGTELGRNCCGGHCLTGKVGNEFVNVNSVDTHFNGWYCSVNKHFLYIDSETGLVYHHQTCQAKFDKTRGSIGSLNNTQEIFDYVIKNKDNIIVCPNNRCGCGMCVPKAKSLEDYLEL